MDLLLEVDDLSIANVANREWCSRLGRGMLAGRGHGLTGIDDEGPDIAGWAGLLESLTEAARFWTEDWGSKGISKA